MEKITLTLPDGSERQHAKGITPLEIAKGISEGLARNAVAAMFNNERIDLDRELEDDGALQILTAKDPEGLAVLRHSCAHNLAQAVKRLYPDAQQTIGPVIENGFMFDFDNLEITTEDLPRIEEEMRKIVKEKFVTRRKDYADATEAKREYKDNPYKIELITEHADKGLSRYDQGEYHDLCRGPHCPHTGWPNAFKLTKVTKAYWRGKVENKQLTRIYGLCFAKKSELDEYVTMLEEAEKRDHRKLGKQLGLIMMHEYSPGAPFFLKKGAIIYRELMDFIRQEYVRRGYDEVVTPLLYDKALWETSGHWEHYRENMFLLESEGRMFSLKPMNCPSHCLIFANEARSYRDLPMRIADFAPLHRNELSGTLTGLTRVRKFSQDDAHIFCMLDQLEQELHDLLDFVRYVYRDVFKMDYTVELSTRPEKSMGTKEQWDIAESALAEVLTALDIPYVVNEGDGAFYGPKIDIHVRDAIGRSHQCATIQVDFQLPQRFELAYEGSDSKKHTPVMIHRAILGSFERFFAVMVEHFVGKFPLWLSPEQVRVLPIADRHAPYAALVVDGFKRSGIRATLDDRQLTTNKKVREAQVDQVNYILVIGDREVEAKSVNVRTRDNEVLGEKSAEEFMDTLAEEIRARA